MKGPTNAGTMTTDTVTALAGKGTINTVYSGTGTDSTSVPSGTVTALNPTVTVAEAGTYLIVGSWDFHTNPSTTQTYAMHIIINGGAINLHMGTYSPSTDSYPRGTICYVATLTANSTVQLALYHQLGSNKTIYCKLHAIKLI